jgi:glutamyl-tRNA synthetase
MADVKVRFPPSPTGLLHVGSARTALYNWLWARHTGGSMVLRFEDTDRGRSTDEAIDQALRVLDWLGIDWDEGPYRQTERFDVYAATAERLLEEGSAYRCYCMPEELDAERARRQAAGEPLIYWGRCRSLTEEQREAFEAQGRSSVVRLKLDPTGETSIDDLVRGTVTWDNSLLGDHILLRSDGSPTYQFANPVDDIDSGVNHIIRGEDLLSSTPRQLALYDALGADKPVYAHLPMILGPDRKKLSKRHGAVSVEEFRDRGYLPEAIKNYLALLGWSYDDRTTVMTTEELVERFSLDRITKSPAVFDFQKLEWLNGEHLRMLGQREYTDQLNEYLRRSGSRLADQPDRVAQVAPVVQEKLRELDQFEGFAGFLFGDAQMDDESWMRVADDPESGRSLAAARDRLEAVESWDAASIEQAMRAACEDAGLKPRVLFTPVRVAISGSTVAPGLFESLELLGREDSLARIADAERNLAAKT